MYENVNTRIKEIRRLFCNDSNKEFAQKMEQRPNAVNNWVRDGYSIGKTVIDNILEKFPSVNKTWLLTGEGEMLKGSVSEPQANYGKTLMADKPKKFIRYWPDVDVTGGKMELFNDSHTNGYESVIIPDFSDCTDAVNLYGDSMSPRYNSGQIVILKEWDESFIAYGQVYLIITKNGFRTVKYLRKSTNPVEVLCVSENPDYDPFSVNKEDILKLYLVKGVIEKTTI